MSPKVRAMHEINAILAKQPGIYYSQPLPYQDPSVVNLRVYAAVDRTIAAAISSGRSL